MMELVDTPATPSFSGVRFRPRRDIPVRARSVGPFGLFDAAGTGGVSEVVSARRLGGYDVLFLLKPGSSSEVEVGPHAKLMQQVKAGFGRTMSRLPEVFGVSRQTLYNWLNGETPKPAYQDKIYQLAQAAIAFEAMGFKPTPASLERRLLHGKSFLQLLAQGEDGKEVAHKLVRVERRSVDSQSRFDAMLGGNKARPDAADMGVPAFKEED